MLSDLLALLGLSWSRLLLYPGGLSACAFGWLWWQLHNRPLTWPLPRIPRFSVLGSRFSVLASQLLACIPPLLLCSLLPLPGAAALARPIDLPVALALLEWPLLLTSLRKLDQVDVDPVCGERLDALRLGYGVLLLAALVLVQATRSFSLDALVALSAQRDLPAYVLRVAGASVWTMALLPLLGLGPFYGEEVAEVAWGMALRAAGHILLAALPWLPLVAACPWLLPLPPLLLLVVFASIQRFGRGGRRAWTLALQAAAVALLALLAWAATTAVAKRL